MKFLELLVNRADPATLAAKDNTPLYLAVEYKRCIEGQLSLIEQNVAKSDRVVRDGLGGDFDLVGRLLYLCYIETVREAEDKEREEEEKNNQTAKDTKDRDKGRERGSGKNHQDASNVDSTHVRQTPRRREGQPLSSSLSGILGGPNPDVRRGPDRRLAPQRNISNQIRKGTTTGGCKSQLSRSIRTIVILRLGGRGKHTPPNRIGNEG